ncbi:MAG: hypothetical protein ACRDRJ_08245 [Streptosporangiaceae bacterium]
MDEADWLAERFEEQRARLRAVAYWMLGSVAEADDAVQNAWLRLSSASRARRRVQGAAPPEHVDLARQRQVVAAFLAALREGNFDGLLALLDPRRAAPRRQRLAAVRRRLADAGRAGGGRARAHLLAKRPVRPARGGGRRSWPGHRAHAPGHRRAGLAW